MKGIIGIFNNLSTLQKSLVVAIVAIVLFLVSSGLTYSLVSSTGSQFNAGKSNEVAQQQTAASAKPSLEEDPNLPKTEGCPLNGSMWSKDAMGKWIQRRPLAVMVENHQEARPQSGLTSADVVYEAVAEGGITRFMAVF